MRGYLMPDPTPHERARYEQWQRDEEFFWKFASEEQKKKRRDREAAEERAKGIFAGFAFIMFALFWGGINIGPSLFDSYDHKTPLIIISGIIITFIGAGGFWYLRERDRKWYVYPLIELGVSAGLAASAMVQTKEVIVSILALLGAVRVAVDGINRLVAFWNLAHPPKVVPVAISEPGT